MILPAGPPKVLGVIMLRSLKMFGMAVVPKARQRRDAVEELVDQGAPAFEAASR